MGKITVNDSFQIIFFNSSHLLQGLDPKTASSSPACLFQDAFRHSLLLLVVIAFAVVGLSVIHLGFSLPDVTFHRLLLLLPQSFAIQSCLLCLPVVGFSVIFLSRHRPLTHSLQLLVAVISSFTLSLQLLLAKVDFSLSQESCSGAIKAAMGQRGDLINFLLHCTRIGHATHKKKNSAKKPVETKTTKKYG